MRGILDADIIIPEHPDAVDPQAFRGEIEFEDVAFAYCSEAPVLQRVLLRSSLARWWELSGQRVGASPRS